MSSLGGLAPLTIVVVNDTTAPITDVRVVYAGHILAADRVAAHDHVPLRVEAERDGMVDIVANVGGKFHEAAGAAHVILHDKRTIELHVKPDHIGAVYLNPASEVSPWASRVGALLGILLAVWFFMWRRKKIKKSRSQQHPT